MAASDCKQLPEVNAAARCYAGKDLPSFDNVDLLILHAHKERTDDLVLPSCLNEFVKGNEHRLHVFGKFT